MSDKPEHAKYGSGIGLFDRMSRWFNATPKIKEFEVKNFRQIWQCPVCKKGEMCFNGATWPMSPQGYHHTCSNDECRFTAALRGESYPRTVERRVKK